MLARLVLVINSSTMMDICPNVHPEWFAEAERVQRVGSDLHNRNDSGLGNLPVSMITQTKT